MKENRETSMESMSPGSLHFIPPNTAHRVAKRWTVPLRFVACWPSDAGHDYDSIRKHGFDVRLRSVNVKQRWSGVISERRGTQALDGCDKLRPGSQHTDS